MDAIALFLTEIVALPYRDVTGRLQDQWTIRGKSFRYLERRVLPAIERQLSGLEEEIGDVDGRLRAHDVEFALAQDGPGDAGCCRDQHRCLVQPEYGPGEHANDVHRGRHGQRYGHAEHSSGNDQLVEWRCLGHVHGDLRARIQIDLHLVGFPVGALSGPDDVGNRP